jgi:hypothetical protein
MLFRMVLTASGAIEQLEWWTASQKPEEGQL